MGLPWSGSTGPDVPVGAGGHALASTAAAWCTAPWAVCSGPGLPVALPAQTGHCSPSSFYFSAKFALISVFFFFPLSLVMSVLLIKYIANGQAREELLFSLAHRDHLSKD